MKLSQGSNDHWFTPLVPGFDRQLDFCAAKVSMSADEEEEIFHLRVFGFDEERSLNDTTGSMKRSILKKALGQFPANLQFEGYNFEDVL